MLKNNTFLLGQGAEEAVHLARNAGLIISKEPVARIEIPSTEEQAPPSLTVVDLPLLAPADSGQMLHPHSGMDKHQDACHLFLGGDEEEEGLVIQRHAHVVLLGDTLDLLIQSFPEMVDQIVGRVTVLASADVHQTDRFLSRLQNIRRNICNMSYIILLSFQLVNYLFLKSDLQSGRGLFAHQSSRLFDSYAG